MLNLFVTDFINYYRYFALKSVVGVTVAVYECSHCTGLLYNTGCPAEVSNNKEGPALPVNAMQRQPPLVHPHPWVLRPVGYTFLDILRGKCQSGKH